MTADQNFLIYLAGFVLPFLPLFVVGVFLLWLDRRISRRKNHTLDKPKPTEMTVREEFRKAS